MKRLIPIPIFILLAFLAACGAPVAFEPVSTPVPLASPTLSADAGAPTIEPMSVPTETATPAAATSNTPTLTPLPTSTFGPTPTETFLPTLDLPTLALVEPAFAVWDGQPTYLADSQPGFYFRLRYDPRQWAQVEDSFGQPALGHREIDYCVLAPRGIRGMSPGLQVEHDLRKIGDLFFEINIVLQQGVRQFVTYQATDTVIFTSFELNFQSEIDECITAAEAVLGTLTSVPQDQATPIP